MHLNRSFLMVCLLALLTPLLMWAADNRTTPNPVGGIAGPLLMWWICSRRKQEPIGGWLLYFYIQLYVGAAVGLVFIVMSLKNYNPAVWQSSTLYGLSVISSLPGQLLLIAQVVIGSILLRKREWKWVNYLRLVFGLDAAFAVLSIFIDQAHFEDSLFFDFWTLIVVTLWLLYFWRSVRVRAVFLTRDWKLAPNTIAA